MSKYKIVLNDCAKFYFFALIGLLAIIVMQVAIWIQGYFLNDCTYCVQFEAHRKLKDFYPMLLNWQIILIPLSIMFGIKKIK